MNKARPTSLLLVVGLVAVGLVVGRLIPPVVVRFGSNVPRVSWAAAATLLLAAAIVGGLAWSTWQSLHKRRQRMTSDYGVTMLAVAKACIAVGCLVMGAYAGFALAFVDALDSPLGKERVVRGAAAAAASLLLLIAALLLERALHVPGDDDETTAGKRAPGASPA